MEGWIKLHRQIKDHWLWKSDNRLKWWIDILLTVNHSDSKVLIKGTLIECKRGQSIRSLESWAKDWNVTKGAVRDFFLLLAKDEMLYTESLKITTRITVCKYEDYQTELHTKKTQRKRKGNAKETPALPKQEGEECNNENNEKEIMIFDEFRLMYLGSKRGNETEFLNFIKKHEDWNQVLPILKNSLLNQIEQRRILKNNNKFVPEWKMLQTWINQRCWEEILITKDPKQKQTSNIPAL